MIQSLLFELISVLFSQTWLSAVPNVHSPGFQASTLCASSPFWGLVTPVGNGQWAFKSMTWSDVYSRKLRVENRPGEGVGRREQGVSFGGGGSGAGTVEKQQGWSRGGWGKCLRVDIGPGHQCTDFKEITWLAQCFTAMNSNPGLLIAGPREDLVVLNPHAEPGACGSAEQVPSNWPRGRRCALKPICEFVQRPPPPAPPPTPGLSQPMPECGTNAKAGPLLGHIELLPLASRTLPRREGCAHTAQPSVPRSLPCRRTSLAVCWLSQPYLVPYSFSLAPAFPLINPVRVELSRSQLLGGLD